MNDEHNCPWCNAELEEDYEDSDIFWCPYCCHAFYFDGYEMRSYEPMSDADYDDANFCRGGDLKED